MAKVKFKLSPELEFEDCSESTQRAVETCVEHLIEQLEAHWQTAINREVPGVKISFLHNEGDEWKE